MDHLVRWYERLVDSEEPARVTSTFRLTDLPADVVGLTLAFLTGYDLLWLSHVNRQVYHGILTDNAAAWQRLTPPQSSWQSLQLSQPVMSQHPLKRFFSLDTVKPPPSGKERYFARRALRFHGALPGRVPSLKRGGAIPLPPSVHDLPRLGSFSFDVVFALMPSHDAYAIRVGGVILGAQSVPATLGMRANHYHQLVYTDWDGNLYCSVMRDQPIIAPRLAFKRWYHVALVFDVMTPTDATQRVYLDGELVDTREGWLHDEWDQLLHAQLGTGRIPEQEEGPYTWCWYAFNGLVDDCRFWHGALREGDVRRLASGGSGDARPQTATCAWSMRDAAVDSAVGTVSCVRSTGPAERIVSHIEDAGALSSGKIPSVHPGIRYCKLP